MTQIWCHISLKDMTSHWKTAWWVRRTCSFETPRDIVHTWGLGCVWRDSIYTHVCYTCVLHMYVTHVCYTFMLHIYVTHVCCETQSKIVSTEIAEPPKSTKSRNSDSSLSRGANSHWDFNLINTSTCVLWDSILPSRAALHHLEFVCQVLYYVSFSPTPLPVCRHTPLMLSLNIHACIYICACILTLLLNKYMNVYIYIHIHIYM